MFLPVTSSPSYIPTTGIHIRALLAFFFADERRLLGWKDVDRLTGFHVLHEILNITRLIKPIILYELSDAGSIPGQVHLRADDDLDSPSLVGQIMFI